MLAKDICQVYWTLLKVMLPTLVIVKILELMGAIYWLTYILEPLMWLVGLPGEAGLVWATAILTNIYTAMIMFFDNTLSVAQVTVLGSMILIAHALPMESAVSKMTGVGWRVTISLRVIGALLFGIITNQIYTLGDWQQQTPVILSQRPSNASNSIFDWAVEQLIMLLVVFCIITLLMTLLRIIKALQVEVIVHWLLTPLLRLLTIGKAASNITIIGITLGLSFGAGLLINEVRSGTISKRDTFLAVCFLCLCHSLIEDTLLILLLGADVMAVLWGRLFFLLSLCFALQKCMTSGTAKHLLLGNLPQSDAMRCFWLGY